MSATLGPPLLDAVDIIRMVLPKEDRYEPKSERVYEPAFWFSTDERHDTPRRLSVFDCTETSVPQARDIHSRPEAIPFSLSVAAIREIDPDRLDVVRDPLPPTHDAVINQKEGVEGHSAILGLHRPPNEPSQITRNLRSRLADLCRRIQGERC